MSAFDSIVTSSVDQLLKTQQREHNGEKNATARLQDEVSNINVGLMFDPNRGKDLARIADGLAACDKALGLPLNEVTFNGKELIFHAPTDSANKESGKLDGAHTDKIAKETFQLEMLARESGSGGKEISDLVKDLKKNGDWTSVLQAMVNDKSADSPTVSIDANGALRSITIENEDTGRRVSLEPNQKGDMTVLINDELQNKLDITYPDDKTRSFVFDQYGVAKLTDSDGAVWTRTKSGAGGDFDTYSDGAGHVVGTNLRTGEHGARHTAEVTIPDGLGAKPNTREIDLANSEDTLIFPYTL